MISKDTAKITISFLYLSDNGKDPDHEYGTLSIYLSWYKSSWTVRKHELSAWVGSFASEDRLLALCASIDEVTNEE